MDKTAALTRSPLTSVFRWMRFTRRSAACASNSAPPLQSVSVASSLPDPSFSRMSEETPAPTFAELACRYLDGRLSEGEHALLCHALLHDEGCAAEFASIVKFESMLRKG